MRVGCRKRAESVPGEGVEGEEPGGHMLRRLLIFLLQPSSVWRVLSPVCTPCLHFLSALPVNSLILSLLAGSGGTGSVQGPEATPSWSDKKIKKWMAIVRSSVCLFDRIVIDMPLVTSLDVVRPTAYQKKQPIFRYHSYLSSYLSSCLAV